MASGPTLPPQAYTREILTSAFNWLQTQPESVKKLATTPDALVGLFMRAQRFGATSMEADAPVSSQAFISDLKNLAEGLKQFEDPRNANTRDMSKDVRDTGRDARRAAALAAQHAQQLTHQMAHQMAQTSATMAPTHVPSGVMSTGPFMSTHHLAHQAAALMSLATEPPPTPTYASPGVSPSQPSSASLSSSLTVPLSIVGLNERTTQMIHEVKLGLNLSSESEAINLMVSLAYRHLKGLLV